MKCVQLPATLRPDGSLGLEAADVRAQMVKDLAAGLKPCAIQLNHGTTGTSSYDPVGDYESLARDYPDLWIHVDGAYAGSSWILPEFQHHAKNVEKVATSFNFNGSKVRRRGGRDALLYVILCDTVWCCVVLCDAV